MGSYQVWIFFELVLFGFMCLTEQRYIRDASLENEECSTAPCKEAERLLLDSINTTVDPCRNFYMYTCGNYLHDNPIPSNHLQYGIFVEVKERLLNRLHDILETPTPEYGWTAEMLKAQMMYRKCMETGESKFMLAEELLKLGGWPMAIGQKLWNRDYFNMFGILSLFQRVGNNGLLSISIEPDYKNSKANIIHIDQGILTLDRDILLEIDQYTISVNAHRNQIVKIVVALNGTNNTELNNELNDMIQFESQLANITSAAIDRQNSSRFYNKMNIADLQLLTDKNKEVIDWLELLKMVIGRNDITENEHVVVNEIQYVIGLIPLLNNTDKRIIANYMMWSFINYMADETFGEIADTKFEYNKEIGGPTEPLPRWNICTRRVEAVWGFAVGRVYVEKYLPPDTKREVEGLVETIREAFIKRLEKVHFMDDDTKQVAIDKVRSIRQLIGYPEWIMNNYELYKYYRNYPDMTAPHFFNMLWAVIALNADEMNKLREPIDPYRFYSTPVSLDAAFIRTSNAMMIPAGMLQSPFYDSGRPMVLNYGAIGSIIGHELTHGFDSDGRQYDKEGNLKPWWSEDVLTKFENETQCFVKQYDNYCPFSINSTENFCVRGEQTLAENIADNGGVEESYQAWKTWQNQIGHDFVLPQMQNYTSDQMFFLSNAYMWCNSYTLTGLFSVILGDEHSPEIYRVNGVLSNSKAFSAAFNCPIGNMNRGLDRCTLW